MNEEARLIAKLCDTLEWAKTGRLEKGGTVSTQQIERLLGAMSKAQAEHDAWAKTLLATARDLGPMFHGQPNAAQVHQLVVDGRVAEAQAKIDHAGRVLDQEVADLRAEARAAGQGPSG